MKCYSPKPPSEYHTLGYGPGVALMSEEVGRDLQGRFDLWNLFYLTNPRVDEYLSGTAAFECASHTEMVVEILDDGSFGFLVEALRKGTLYSVAARLKNHPRFKGLSLTQQLGAEWVGTMLQRAGQTEPELEAAGNVVRLNFRR
jgi:hypothetical protein